jgi:DDE superfamily endonuclease
MLSSYSKQTTYLMHQQRSAAVMSAVAHVSMAIAQRELSSRRCRTRRRRMRRTTNEQGRTTVPTRRVFRPRRRRSVEDVYKELGDVYFRRAYRMKYCTFQRLASMLRAYIIAASGKKQGSRNYIPNGPISTDVRLACALRWFAGGSVYDIMTTYGIGHTDTIASCWYVVDAVNNHPNFTIVYPSDHNQQRSIAEGFSQVSAANFECCAGAIDGMLIWIHKPSKKDCIQAGCSSGKFFCGRKKKFGLNCQAVCDVRGRILDVSILYPGSTSDCLAFEGMSLFHKLEDGMLAPGLCLFGDNAYLNTQYMATPFPAVSGGSKDAYNFYHSQLRIRIECTFGMLTHRWGMLRSAIPMNVTVRKSVALVLSLAKLHNFCIDFDDSHVLPQTATDEWQNELQGAVPLVQTQHLESQQRDNLVPEQLIGGGNHFDDIGVNGRHNRQRRYNYFIRRNEGILLPRDRLHSLVDSAGLTRPAPLPPRR